MIPYLLIVSRNVLNELISNDSFSSEWQTTPSIYNPCLSLNIRDL